MKTSVRLAMALATALALAALVACGDDPDTTQPPAPVSELAPTAEPTAAPTATPAPTATAVPTATPAPTATAVPTSTPAPTATAVPTSTPPPTPTAGPTLGMSLGVDCLPGGVLDDVGTISSCAEQAMQQVKSFSFEGEINLLAIFPVEGAGPEGLMRLSGDIALPDRLRFQISLGPEGEMVQVHAVAIGEDTYVQDPESDLWFKGAPPDSEFLGIAEMASMVQLPQGPDATLSESITLDDGSMGYVIHQEQVGQQGGMEGLGLPGGKLVAVVGADDFLTREVRVVIEDGSDEAPALLAFRYHGYNEPKEIEPPSQFITLPEGAMDPAPADEPIVVGLAKNDEGDVEVTFSAPVRVEGEVELYVLDPATGGWGLPLLGGSGTDTLIFDADAEGRPPLVAGESQIAGFGFPIPNSDLKSADGAWVNLNFDLWTYP